MRLFRPTLRIRMALLYGGLVLLVAIFLLLVSLLLVDRSVSRSGLYAHPQQTVFTDPTRSDPVSVKVLRQQARHDVRDYLIQNGLIYFAIIVVVATLGGYLLAKSALRPIAKVTKTAQQLSTETLNQRIALGGPYDELRELADTFDEMLARLDAAFEGQRQFVANASHELRTPLSVISTELDVTLADPNASSEELRRMGEVVKAAADRAQRLVGSLLTLARLQAGVRGALEVNDPVDLAALVPTALAAVSVEASARLISIEQELAPARTLGDPRLLERLIGNLVENAVRHNVRSGWLRITSGESGGWAWLHVANGGPIIPQAEVMSLFQAFRRGSSTKARTASRGAGLGLSIVRLIVDAHHGKLQAAAPPFGGLAIRVELDSPPEARAGRRVAAGAPQSTERSEWLASVRSSPDGE